MIGKIDKESCEKVEKIIEEYCTESRFLIPIIQDVQNEYRYLPPELLRYIAGRLHITEAKAYSVATFYENFSFEQKGKYVIKVCDGTACHVRRSTDVLEKLREVLQLKPGQKTTDDMLFTLETVSCLGACGLAPVLTVNDEVHPAMTPEKVVELMDSIMKEEQA